LEYRHRLIGITQTNRPKSGSRLQRSRGCDANPPGFFVSRTGRNQRMEVIEDHPRKVIALVVHNKHASWRCRSGRAQTGEYRWPMYRAT
jgi:hypothetical protein